MWLFGYGSLLFKPPLHDRPIHKTFVRVEGRAEGFIRRFWQSSCDNRGTPVAKGRVVTIVPAESVSKDAALQDDVSRYELAHLTPKQRAALFEDPQALAAALTVAGCAYHIPQEHVEEALSYLDAREQDGYGRHAVPFTTASGHVVSCLVYVGTETNESYVGPESPHATAAIIRTAVGDSGPNVEYLTGLVEALAKNNLQDPYLSHLCSLL